MTGKTYRVLFYCFIITFCSSATYAALINTPLVHVEASIGQPPVWSNSADGSYIATVDSGGAVTDHNAYNSLSVAFDSPEEAIVTFDRNLSKTVDNGEPEGSYSKTTFFYEAIIDSTVNYSWYLTYVFSNGAMSGLLEGGNVKLNVYQWDGNSWGNTFYSYFNMGPAAVAAGYGVYSGNETFNLVAGNDYRIILQNSGAAFQSTPSSALTGTVSFDFNGAEVLACEGDFDDVDGSDLAVFAADFGRTDCSGDCEGDFDGDNDVDGSDLATFAADFGRTDCPEP